MIVVDVNVIAFFMIQGDRTRDAQAVRERDGQWVVPPFWAIEFQGILWKYVRFGGMPEGTALDLLEQARAMFGVNEAVPYPELVLRDALKWGIAVYDAQYVSLARQLAVPCVTEDGPLQKACPGIAFSIEAYLGTGTGGNVVHEPRASYGATAGRKYPRSKRG
jgi:predicted nucleic acid-binding protein